LKFFPATVQWTCLPLSGKLPAGAKTAVAKSWTDLMPDPMPKNWQEALFDVSAALQLAAVVFVLLMARTASDKRPWWVLGVALSVMFVQRILANVLPGQTRLAIGPILAPTVSALLFFSLFFIRRLAISERDSENRYRSLVELSPDAIVIVVEGKIVYGNRAADRMFGVSTGGSLVELSVLQFTPGDSPAHGRPVTGRWRRVDGSPVDVESASSAILWQRSPGLQLVLRDVTERKRGEEEKSRLLASERAARSVAEHASRMKDEFLATLSHELRTPLNAILGWSHLLLEQRPEPDELAQGLETIERNAKVQTRLIEDLLDMSRIISGKLRIHVARIDPRDFIAAAVETVRPGAEGKGVSLEIEIDPRVGMISGDASRLQQVVWNLASNAIKFTPAGGRVRVTGALVAGQLELSVTDTGQGIPANFLPYVFERFRQADGSTTRHHGGLGLGLAIVKQLVEMHGGSVRAFSDGEGTGSRFVVTLPTAAVVTRTDSGDRVGSAHGGDPDRAGMADLTGVRVLVVDDEMDARELVRRVLVGVGAVVKAVPSAVEVMQSIGSIDVLVSDIGMPEVDGYELLRRVRTLPPEEGGRVPAVALTAFARSEDRTRALLSGFQVHLSKPFTPAELVATVASAAGRTGHRANHPAASLNDSFDPGL
jgi:PAS domain S-box-containing protein